MAESNDILQDASARCWLKNGHVPAHSGTGGAGILTSASEISGRFLDDVLANFLQNQHLISSQTSVEYHDLTVVLLNIAGIMLEDLT